MFGFLYADLEPKYGAKFYAEIPGKVQRGEIKYREDVTWGLENVSQAFVDMLTGKNTGKSVVVVGKE